MRILLIEDDRMIADALRRALAGAGMEVDWARDGEEGEGALRDATHALVLLDLGLPLRDGFDLLASLRLRGDRVPLMVLSARDDLESRVRGLDFGADDYLVKPFEMTELLARMRALLRRQAGHAHSVIGTDETRLDLATRQLTFRESNEVLPAREFALMRALLERPGQILSRSQLEDRIYSWGNEVESNAIDVLIHYVRRKFGAEVIRNVRGVGWLVPPRP
ncbi:response regulator transcription factor [Amaricoccus sp.]|uniref:response regulator n=1 Tax=Amaricoccus sp. TaxID=1872485 RepID=UPI0026096913|nr:response regulator transcription factor [uncultured Amaricoccus sp.]